MTNIIVRTMGHLEESKRSKSLLNQSNLSSVNLRIGSSTREKQDIFG